MEIAILLGLLGFGFAAGMGGGSNDDATSDAEPEDTDSDGTTEPDAPQTFEIGDSVLTYDVTGSFVIGTEGDDTVIGDEGDDLGGPDIFLGAGDDYADPLIIETEIHGGDGNDTLVAYDRSELFGDDGDDLLIGEGGGSSQGGNGNDTISDGGIASGGAGDDVVSATADPYTASAGYLASISGDEGDDTLTAHSYWFGSDTSNYDSLLDVTGGEGSDAFDIQITLPREGSAAHSLEDIERDTFLNIVDFNPDEDVLTIQISGNEGQSVEMTSAEIVLRDFADVGSPGPVLEQVVQMNFAATETTGTFTTWVRVNSDVEITIDDIEFMAGPGIIMGEVLTILDDGGDINGTDGNDTLISEISGNEDLYRDIDIGDIRLGNGDDLADVALFAGNIYGELGDDTITTTGIDGYLSGGDGDDLLESNGLNIIEGGEGNDTLIGAEAEQMYGGAGDDVLSANIDATYDGGGVIDGGVGDDTLSVSTAIGYSRSDFPYFGVVGGEGADVVELQLNMSDGYDDEIDLLNSTSQSTAIYLSDFNADENSLVIHIDRADGNEARDMTSAEIVTTEREFQGEIISTSNIVMTFSATDTFGEHTSTIGLGNDVNLTIDDIVFVQN